MPPLHAGDPLAAVGRGDPRWLGVVLARAEVGRGSSPSSRSGSNRSSATGLAAWAIALRLFAGGHLAALRGARRGERAGSLVRASPPSA